MEASALARSESPRISNNARLSKSIHGARASALAYVGETTAGAFRANLLYFEAGEDSLGNVASESFACLKFGSVFNAAS